MAVWKNKPCFSQQQLCIFQKATKTVRERIEDKAELKTQVRGSHSSRHSGKCGSSLNKGVQVLKEKKNG